MTAVNDMLLWLTWVGTIAASVLIVLRFGGWRPALIVFGAFVSFALMGLWEQSIQTLSLMSAAVLLSLAIGIPMGVLAGRSDRVHRAITPALDAMQIVPAFAYLMPVVILFSVGPAAAVICTMIYAIPPAVRITALGIRGVDRGLGGGRPRVRLHPVADALQGAAAARSPPAAAVGQPDDHVRALAGRDRRPDRRPRARRRRDQRPLLEPRAGDPRRHRDRDHGDRARPRDVRHRRPHRPRPRRTSPRRASGARGSLTLATFGGIAAIVLVARALGADSLYPDEFETADHGLHRHDRRRPAALDPLGARLRPGPGLVHLRDHRADRELPARVPARAAARAAGGDALVRRARRADARSPSC